MIAEAIKYLQDGAHGTPLNGHEDLFTKPVFRPPAPPMAAPIEVSSLASIIPYLTSPTLAQDLEGEPKPHLLVVQSHCLVELCSPLSPRFRQREIKLRAKYEPRRLAFCSGSLDTDTLRRALISEVADDEERARLIAAISKVTEVRDTTDDGLLQVVVNRIGLEGKASTTLGGAHILKPWRTFREVDQPAVPFVLRAEKGPSFSLIEEGGDAWKLAARASIATFLRSQIDAAGPSIPVQVTVLE